MDLTVRRLEMSIFGGWNPEGWIYRAERYFCLNKLSAPEKMEAAAISLGGEALAWFQWEDHRRPFRSWKESKLRLLVLQSNPGRVLVREVFVVKAGFHRSGVSPGFRILGVVIAESTRARDGEHLH